MALPKLSLVHQTVFADLVQRCADAAFEFPENGSFLRVKSRGREFWYHSLRARDSDTKIRTYVGPADDPAINARIENFKQQKVAWRDRWDVVKSLHAAGLVSPPAMVGNVVAAMARAGIFRLHGVLVGSLAFQTYAGLLGVKFPGAALMTADIDFAQFHAVSVFVEDSLPPLIDLLRKVDPTYRQVPHIADPAATIAFTNASDLRIEFLTPNRGKDDYAGEPIRMPALGGASAQALRFLDFLIRYPIDSVLLHQGGVAVKVPAPERYAVHKLIVATRRRKDRSGLAKIEKDLRQAGMLIEAMSQSGPAVEVGMVWAEAWDRGAKWQEALTLGRKRLRDEQKALLDEAIREAAINLDRDPNDDGVPPRTAAGP